jgi:hypothetical protein
LTEPARQSVQAGGIRKISDETMRRLEQETKKEVGNTLTSAQRGSKLHKLALALSLLDMVTSNRLGKHHNQTLGEFDSDARDVLGMRQSEVQALADKLLADPEVTAAFKRAYQRAQRTVLGGGYRTAIQQYANYILSDTFFNSLPAKGKARANAVGAELKKLMALDPDIARTTSAEFLGLEITRNPCGVISTLTEPERIDAIYRVLTLLAELDKNDPECRIARDSTGPQHSLSGERGSLETVVGGAKGGAKAIKTGQKVAALLQDVTGRAAIARALGQAMTHRNFYGIVGDEVEAGQLVALLEQRNHKKAAEFIRRIQSGSGVGRGLTFFTGLVALAGVVVTFPPVDAQGRIKWNEIGAMSSALASFGGNLPTYTKFVTQDIRVIARWVMRKEAAEVATAIARGGKAAATAAKASKFTRFCKVLGPIGDILAIPVIGYAMYGEIKNEDTVGTICQGVSLSASVIGLFGLAAASGSTGIGLPLAVVAVVAGLGALIVDSIWGESAMTGQIRQDLRYLGITDGEDQVHRNLAQRTVTRTAYPVSYGYGYGMGYGGSSYTYQAQQNLPLSQVRTNAASANIHQKVALINHYMDQSTSGSEETLIYNIFKDTRGNQAQFLQLVESVDTKVVALELETDGQATDVLYWILNAYTQAGKPPTMKFGAYLEHVACEHRDEVIHGLFNRLNPSDKKTYHGMDPASIRRATEKLMSGYTDGAEERAIYRLLLFTDYPQFNRLIEGGGVSYVKNLRSELSSSEWANVRKWMLDVAPGKASARVQHIAWQVR